jgi:hypothetical protein
MMLVVAYVTAQSSPDSLSKAEGNASADDPSQFFTRIELFNEWQHYNRNGGFDLNQTTLRTIVKIGKRFTTRLDIPYVYNSITAPPGYRHSGIGDLSFRLLGYKFYEKPKSAFTASIEISMNTAQSPLLGTGKNIISPVFSYSKLIPRQKIIFAMVLQQALSVGGYKSRAKVSFTKLQAILLKTWSKRIWSVLAPEWYLDYVNGGLSMNLEARMAYAPTKRINIWGQGGAGMFGNFVGRYQWSASIGFRYFLLRSMNLKKN